jgi:Terminase large subunit, T4likevirus-type, N-terminal
VTDLDQLATPRLSAYVPHVPTDQQTAGLVAHRFLPGDEPSEVFYGGAAGGGKTDWLLMGALEWVDVPGYAALLLRRSFAELALPGSLMDRSKRWLSGSGAHWNEQLKRWTFPAGSTLAFGYLETDSDLYRYQSAEFQMIGFDELTEFTEAQYTYLFSRLRRPSEGELAAVPLRMCAASNPGGIGHGWVKKRFPIDGKPRGRRVFIPAKIADNPHLDTDAYRASLARLSPTLQRQLEEGDWTVAEGLAFPEWRREVHVVPEFPVPPHWHRIEFMDHGVANPTAWYVAATDEQANLVVFDSYYAPGLISEHVEAILARRPSWWPEYRDADGIVRRPTPLTWADPSVRNRTGQSPLRAKFEPETIATEYAKQSEHKIALALANNDPKAGRIRISELLKLEPGRPAPYYASHLEGAPATPRLYLVRSRCPELAQQLEDAPLLPIDSGKKGAGEIVDPAWEGRQGHAVAALRYGVMGAKGPSPASEDDEPWEVSKKRELLREYEEKADRGGYDRRRFEWV